MDSLPMFLIEVEFGDIIDCIDAEDYKRLFQLIFEYVKTGEVSLDGENNMVKICFNFAKRSIDYGAEKYSAKLKANRLNGQKGGRPRKSDDCEQTAEQDSETENPNNPSVFSETQKTQNKNKNKNKKENKNKNKDKDKKENKNKNKADAVLSAEADESESFERTVEAFNSICKSLPKVQKLTDARKAEIASATELLGNTSFEEVFRQVEQSEFLTGKTGKWNGCSFDWILKPENLIKIIEGTYDTKPPDRQFLGTNTSYNIEELDRINIL